MSEQRTSPSLLFTPERSSSTPKSDPPGPPQSPSLKASSPSLTRSRPTASRQAFYVSVPALSAQEKESYTQFSEELIPSDDEFAGTPLHSIIGEYKEGSKAFYFVKLSENEQAYKIFAKRMQAKYPELVERYQQRKAEGLLEPFDPQASYVHPGSRVQLKISLNFGQPRSQTSPSSLTDSDDAAQESLDGGLESDTYTDPAPSRRSSRHAVLPFSPRTTRSRKVYAQESDGASAVVVPTRRSTRAKKGARSNLDDEDFEGSLGSRSPKKRPAKKNVRGADSRPAYGHVRDAKDLDYDSDEETGALRAHRNVCEKCHRQPTLELLRAASRKVKKRKSKKSDDEDEGDETEKLNALGGWVRCLKCPVSAHWGCLAKIQRDEILRAILEKDRAQWRAKIKPSDAANGDTAEGSKPSIPEPGKRSGLEPDRTTEFICGSCMKGGFCMMCHEAALAADGISQSISAPSTVTPQVPPSEASKTADVEMADAAGSEALASAAAAPEESLNATSPGELLFRCFTCKRLAHYAHLPSPDPGEEYEPAELAEHYQTSTHWQCADCVSFVYTVEYILAWRPFPAHVVEPLQPANEPVNYKLPLPREYLIKWADRSYRRLQWVPHMWLVATHPAKLKNFLSGVVHVELLPEPVADDATDSAMTADSTGVFEPAEDGSRGDNAPNIATGPSTSRDPMPDAERRIQPLWKTADRVLDVLLWHPMKRYGKKKPAPKRGSKGKTVTRVNSDADETLDDGDKEEAEKEYEAAFNHGDEPSQDLTETVEEFEHRTGGVLGSEDIDRVVWAFFKWNGLGYDTATWDSPPKKGETGYVMFEKAFDRLIASREVTVPVRGASTLALTDKRPRDAFIKKNAYTPQNQPELGQDEKLRLMPFQVDGVNWLCNNWWNLQHCILADEMGLGKTVQIVTFLGAIINLSKAFPALVVVPNSTVTNWVREFERWAPGLRVCPFYGEAKSREIIKKYELSHTNKAAGTTGAKYHVLVTTYETITNPKEFTGVFKQNSRWEVLVVDEGQRLKNDSSLIFKRLNELNTAHRIILTGTPLNNNIRELFNLMNFLDPVKWSDLEKMAKEHEELTEERIKELHNRLRPYFLRRVKSEVLQLPPKNEVIVPVTMASLQKEIYRSILSQNVALLKSLSQELGATTRVNAAVKNAKNNMNNILMQLRKCLQHPYLVSRDIEPSGLSPADAHEKLIDASAKLRFLKVLLPKLKARGHRVLLFSQFSIALNILEDYLIGEKFKYLRLDGNTKQTDRQKDMDEFNKPDSDVFIYLLTTRAGGVGINLWTADTVIIFDPDFNPHQDLQAIARAHRFGQKKTCLVFKLMVKDSAEERIMQTGKKKLVLDHLIVQKMDDDESKEDVQSILMFGAQTLFQDGENQASRDVNYSDHDIDNLIEKSEKEGDQSEEQAKEGTLFSFAKVWAADKDSLEEIGDETDSAQQADSWAQTLQRLAHEMSKHQEEEVTGRGVRRRAAAVFPVQQNNGVGDTPQKDKNNKKGKKGKAKMKDTEDSDAYAASVAGSEDESASNISVEPDEFTVPQLHKVKDRPQVASSDGPVPAPLSPILNRPVLLQSPVKEQKERICGLCGTSHAEGTCFMTESAENLAEFRNILLSHAGDETIEERRAAIAIIDETLHKRGKLHLIFGQPLHLVENSAIDRRPSHPIVKLNPVAPGRRPAATATAKATKSVTATTNLTASTSKQSALAGARLPKRLWTAQDSNMVPLTSAKVGAYSTSPNPLLSTHYAAFAKPKHPDPKQNGMSTLGTQSVKTGGLPSGGPVNGSSMSVPRPKPRPLFRVSGMSVPTVEPSPASGSSKRPLQSPMQAASPSKKMKDSGVLRCSVCNGPHHLVKDCPVVLKGSRSIQSEINRLETDSVNAQTVHVLQNLLQKQKRRELNASAAPPMDVNLNRHQ